MIRTELPVPRAFIALIEAVRVSLRQPNARQFALTWLAAARMYVMGRLPELKSLNDLNTESGWRIVEATGLPIDAVGHLFASADKGDDIGLRARAVAIVTELQAELGTQKWDVLPSLTALNFKPFADFDGTYELIPPVAELLLDLAGAPDGWLWLPFDNSGAMTIRALRRGWQVNAASMTEVSNSTLLLLLAIETGSPSSSSVHTVVDRDGSGRPSTTAPYVIAVPPFGVDIRHARLGQWDSTDGKSTLQYARSETWAVHELVNRATKRAIFLVPAGVLFTKGQEHRLREYLLHRGGERNELEAVVALPPGVLPNTNLATAILVTSPFTATENVRMVDLGIAKRTLANVDDTVLAGRLVALGLEDDAERARNVTRGEIMKNDCTFTPSRYVRRQVEVGPNAVLLEELCQAIRPPTVTKDGIGTDVMEVGIPELGGWGRLVEPFTKQVKIKSRGRDMPTLAQGDIVISVKGTVGKAGLVGPIAEDTAVVSQSCIGLRVNPRAKGVTLLPEYLLMYLRSESGRTQIEGLQVGAGVPHVGPATLLGSFLVPVPNLEEQHKVVEDYGRLCELDAQIADIQLQMKNIAQKRWVI